MYSHSWCKSIAEKDSDPMLLSKQTASSFSYQQKSLRIGARLKRRASNRSIKFLLVFKAENIRSGLLDEFSSREACSSSAFSSSKVGTYCSQEELLLGISGHSDGFVIIKKSEQCNCTPTIIPFVSPLQ